MSASPIPHALYQVVERLGDAVLLFDATRRCEYANPAAHALAASFDREAGLAPLLALLPEHPVAGTQVVALGSADAPRTLRVTVQLRDGGGSALLLHDASADRAREAELERRHAELSRNYLQVAGAQEILLQSEKMASIGQLAAGVAHEINNPIGYVHSNLGTLQDYLRRVFSLIETYERALADADPTGWRAEIEELRQKLDIEFLALDLPQLLSESREGIERVTKIVQDLKDFSYSGRNEPFRAVDLHKGLESTLNIVWNELKYKVTLEKRYGELPPVECLPSELNQVFMNILVNAGQAIRERGTIALETGVEGDEVWVSVADSGEGISEDALARVFDPFFTTKPVGHGTGLGLSISYGIVAKHNGRIEVSSQVGQGTTFRVVLPVRQPKAAA
ncbi:ATP-binding protein [Coralloluteibacterium stylophorae]|uniref:histidine kinase n=1 Tax=Coralloluteibacterium stylophorae TaxID=1776034 RepID=A0A8J8B158_9GAMM|nr:ATP-binding protein [Coralloluteibacterium stylophorae]MBS7457189.1 sensor histidine kinase [Coralloluteibacterium stylophorae]